MLTVLIVSQILSWIVILGLGLALLALARQVGVLHVRVAPAGALLTGALCWAGGTLGRALDTVRRRSDLFYLCSHSPTSAPQATWTISLPKFRPFNRPMNASGAFSKPSTTSSRY